MPSSLSKSWGFSLARDPCQSNPYRVVSRCRSLRLSQVSDWTFAHNLHPVEAPTALPSVAISAEALQQRSVPAPKADSKYILLVSGLHIGNPPLPTGMLCCDSSCGYSELCELYSTLLFPACI
jgi:hypothetical protein